MADLNYGVDISREWNFQDGDLILVSDEENVKQSIINRLNTLQGELAHIYNDYGSILQTFLGWRRVETTLAFIKLEVEKQLEAESRITGYTVDVSFAAEGVRVDIDLPSGMLNFVLNNDGLMEV